MQFWLVVLFCLVLCLDALTRPLPDANTTQHDRRIQEIDNDDVSCPIDYNFFFCLQKLSAIYFHGVFELSRPSSFALLVHQICRGMAMCIPRENFRIVLHKSDQDMAQYYRAISFLDQYSIPYVQWQGPFDTYTIHLARLQVLNDVYSFDKYILQADSDEFVPLRALQRTLAKFSSLRHVPGSCGVVMGTLQDRITRDGHLPNITIDTDLAETFPLRCSIKKRLEQAEYRKIVLYNSVYRPWIGNHKLVCEGYSSIQSCFQRIGMPRDLLPFYSHMRAPPQPCTRDHLPIYHLKYVWGLQEYLTKRVERFRSRHIRWYSESVNVLKHLQSHAGRICVECEDFECREEKLNGVSEI